MKSKHRKSTRGKRTSRRSSGRKSRHRARRSKLHRSAPHAAKPRTAARVDGVNVNDLVVMAELIKNKPELAEYTFRATTHWLGGAHARTHIQGLWGAGKEDRSRKTSFTLDADEPSALLGTNHGPSPVEFILAGLGASLAEGIAYNAAARGIKLEELDIQLEGGLDLRGALGIRESAKPGDGDKELRPGFQDVRILCRLKSDAPPSELKELVEYAKQNSPVLDMLRHPVPVALELQH